MNNDKLGTADNDRRAQKKEELYKKLVCCAPDDQIVISGISGTFPLSENVKELCENLMAKKNLITLTDIQLQYGTEEDKFAQFACGFLKENTTKKFDAEFFHLPRRVADLTDPMGRILTEKAYEIILDAGYNPEELKNTNTAVYVGLYYSEAEQTWQDEDISFNGYGFSGCSRFSLANRISHVLKLTGTSYTVDTACSSSFAAFHSAFTDLRAGVCDAAIVGGCNLCAAPMGIRYMYTLNLLNPEGKSSPFDESGYGYIKAETVAAVLLQRKKDARRMYAEVVYSKGDYNNAGDTIYGTPSAETEKRLMKEFYEECRIKPEDVEFIETHGTGTLVGDLVEAQTLEEAMCPQRTTPLKIGSIKSNMGHAESASGICALAKVILSYENEMLIPNINFRTPRANIPALHNGKLSVVTELEKWEPGLVGINNFGFGGADYHVLLRPNPKKKVRNGEPLDDLPRLVMAAGRSREAVNLVLEDFKNRPIDAEYVRLMQEIHSFSVPNYNYRGYVILKKNCSTFTEQIEEIGKERRPLWFVFAGMGSQWPAMGKSMMKLPIFAESIRKCHQILEPKGLNVINILTSEDPSVLENILHSFVGISAIQIALVDLLHYIGIVPDGIIGHSLGELGCGYADGCLTAQQMMLSAYYRGLVSMNTAFIKGSMASIGLGYNDVKDKLPPKIYVACHNGPQNCTISGPEEVVQKFVNELKDEGVFTREVKTSNIPFHSPYIAEAGKKLLLLMEEVIPKPMTRSHKWISTSNLEAEWDTDKAKYSSAEYYTNNLLNSVYFEEALTHLPKNAIAIEIAPHGLLQAILKRSLGNDSLNIPLMLRTHSDNMEHVLSALGRIFIAGLHPLVQRLYPAVEFPVSRGTPMISPLIRWNHDEDRFVSNYRTEVKKDGRRRVTVCPKNLEYSFLFHHVIDRVPIYPAAGYLLLVWKTFAEMHYQCYEDFSVRFEKVRFIRATVVPSEENLEFTILIQRGDGSFEILEKDTVVVRGKIYRLAENDDKSNLDHPEDSISNTNNVEKFALSSADVYKELRLRGYNYEGVFTGIRSSNLEGTIGRIRFEKNYVGFLDSIFQLYIMKNKKRKLYVPLMIDSVALNMKQQRETVARLDPEKPEFTAYLDTMKKSIKCGGIEVIKFGPGHFPRKKDRNFPILRKIEFVPFTPHAVMDVHNVIRICTQIVIQNMSAIVLKTLEIVDQSHDSKKSPISEILNVVFEEIPLIKLNSTILLDHPHPNMGSMEMKGATIVHDELPKDEKYLIIIKSNMSEQDFQKYSSCMTENSFLLTRESLTSAVPFKNMEILFDYNVGDERFVLLRKPTHSDVYDSVIRITNDSYAWLPVLKEALNGLKNAENGKVILYAQGERYNGILGLANCLTKEYGNDRIRCFFIMDETAPPFSVSHPFYKSQLAKDMSVNVYKNNSWGIYANAELENLKTRNSFHAFVKTLKKGSLRTLRWVEGPLNPLTYEPVADKQLIYVYYSPLNFRDTMLATGKLTNIELDEEGFDDEVVHGFEFSGKQENGRRVMGIIDKMGMATLVETETSLLWEVPVNWTLEDAATVPVVYATVLYALFRCGNMKKGESILIHAGTGGIGQAAINICLHYNCTIFTTVGTPEKREFIRKTFPSIPDSRIGNSRDTSFTEMIMKETNGRGVDLVLNSLAEEKLLASVSCLGLNGRFLEIGLFDIYLNNPLDLGPFEKQISFHSIILTKLMDSDDETKASFFKLFQEFLRNGAIKPLSRTVFVADEVEKAFRYLASGKHMGKVILKIRDENDKKPEPIMLNARRRVYCSKEKSYIICGGLGGLGLELTDWLILRGARNLVLSSRHGITNGYQAYRLKNWKSSGANVVVSTENIATEEGVRRLIENANSLGPVSGIFNLAVALDDKLFENQTEESFAFCAQSKAIASFHLDRLSRTMCPNLEYFVLFSSLVSGYGNAGQTNYAMTNSVMEQICEQRFNDKLPALAIEWGPMGDVGVVAKNNDLHKKFNTAGMELQTVISFLEVMDYFMTQSLPLVSSFVMATKHLSQRKDEDILDIVSNILGIKDIRSVDPNITLINYGLDSMAAVELKQVLETNFNVFLNLEDLKTATFGKLFEIHEKINSKTNIDRSAPGETDSFYLLLKLMLASVTYQLENIENENDAFERIAQISPPTSDKTIPSEPLRTVFTFPGVEGFAKGVEQLCLSTNVRYLCFQYPSLNEFETLEDAAKEFVKIVKNTLGTDDEFVFLACSFGCLIAMEVARILENEGRSGKLYLIDCIIPNHFRDFWETITSDQVKRTEIDILLFKEYLSYSKINVTSEMDNEIRKLPDQDSRINWLETKSQLDPKYNAQRLKSITLALVHKFDLFIKYGELKKLSKTRGFVVKGRQWFETQHDLVENVFEQPIKVQVFDEDHLKLLQNEKIGEIIMEDIMSSQKMTIKDPM